jgi:hypothetical protein
MSPSLSPVARCFRLCRIVPVASRLALAGVALAALALPCHGDDGTAEKLPDAPLAQSSSASGQAVALTGPGKDNTFFGLHVGPAYPAEAGKWDTIIHPGERAPALSATDKLLYAGHEQIQPVVLVPGLLSAGWGQLVDANPHYGVDAAGFGERFGAALLRQASDRLTGDGLFAAAFQQDPRYYREGHGPIVHRGLRAVHQTFFRLNDHGVNHINASGILGHAVGNFLAMAYYPRVSTKTNDAASGFATSIAGDMGSKLFLEFGPDLLRLAFRRNP